MPPIPVPSRISVWWTVAPAPDLRPYGLQPATLTPGTHANEPNDHCFFRAADGHWHLWACVRNTAAGRVLCHWSSPDLLLENWKLCGDFIRCDRLAGESLTEEAYRHLEFLQSPFVIVDRGLYYMFYGGYDSGHDRDGNPVADYSLMEKQLCLMTSPDGLHWTRHRDAQGRSRVFCGPGAVRDPMMGYFRGQWHVYYAGHHDQDRYRAGIYARRSSDLIHWSDWSLVQYDPTPRPDGRPILHESPFVLEHQGRFYLFRNPGLLPGTQVFVSDDPLDFGLGASACAEKWICHFSDVIAPEVFQDAAGQFYISRINSPAGYGIQLARLDWR